MGGRGKKMIKEARSKKTLRVAKIAVDDPVQEQLADPWSQLRLGEPAACIDLLRCSMYSQLMFFTRNTPIWFIEEVLQHAAVAVNYSSISYGLQYVQKCQEKRQLC